MNMVQVNPKKALLVSKLVSLTDGKPHGLVVPSEYVYDVSCKSNPGISVPWVFVAINGSKVDGHQFIEDAFRNGAALAIVSDTSALTNRYPGIEVADTLVALSAVSSELYDHPSNRLMVLGVTGTNGKTTINWLIWELFNILELKCSRLGTLGFRIGDVTGDTGLTTPDAVTVNEFLFQTVSRGFKSAVLEVSSHALSQNRVDHVNFDIAIYTNLTRDHLDYHRTFDEYKDAKWRLFELLINSNKSHRCAVINIDCPFGAEFAERLSEEDKGIHILRYGKSSQSDVQILDLKQSFTGSQISFQIAGSKFDIRSPFIGYHNAYNVAAVLAVAHFKGLLLQAVKALADVAPVPGRLQPIRLSEEFGVYVDYAHSPDALDNVLRSLRPLVKRELKVLFGCGGDRDRGKRPLMRAVSTALADRVYISSDNPRTEDPVLIINNIVEGATKAELDKLVVEIDRKAAIAKALREIRAGDILLVAGKGHEDYQIIGTTKHHFSDAEELESSWRTLSH